MEEFYKVTRDLIDKAKILIQMHPSFCEDDFNKLTIRDSNRFEVEAWFYKHECFDDPEEFFIDLTPYINKSIDYVKMKVRHYFEEANSR